MTEALTPVEIFCSYAHKDEEWRKRLETHLSLLKRQGLISFWHDRLIVPGTDWAKAIDTHLETASVILLLVSADFFASDYCYGIEMKRALEREAEGSARVIPILVHPADWTDAPFAHLQALPADAKPIASWSNKETALADVAAGIRRVIVEELPQLSASVPRVALPKIWNIPYPRNPFFLGRDTELAQMREYLLAGQTTVLSLPQAISGLGGIGKTQLALEYAYRYRHDYQIILWVHAESTEALISSYLTIADLLQLPKQEKEKSDETIQSVKTWLQTHHGWLMILDNADDLTLLSNFLPPSLGGSLLLTTRAAVTGRLAQRLEIETLLPEQGALLLLHRASLLAPDAKLSQASQEEQNQALRISQELGGLPLALDQAGAYLEETRVDLANYWQIYQQRRADLLLHRGELVVDHPDPVATTWLLSFQRVEEKNPAAADMLRLCAYLSPDAIPEEIFTAGASLLGPLLAPVASEAFLFNQAIKALRDYSLVQRDSREKILSIHRLVQAVLQDTLEETERHVWAKRATLSVSAAFRDASQERYEHLLPHALLVVQYINVDQIMDEEAGLLLEKTALYLYSQRRFEEAKVLGWQTLRFAEQQRGFEHPSVASMLIMLATIYVEQDKYTEAEPLVQRALKICEQSLGPEWSTLARLFSSLAFSYLDVLKHAEAEQCFRQTVRIREQHGETDTMSLFNLGSLCVRHGNYTEAELFYRKGLQIQEQYWGSEVFAMGHFLDRLALVSKLQGKYEQAELLYQRLQHIQEQQLGPEHSQVANTLNELAKLYRDQNKYAEAEPLFQRALHIREREFGTHHLVTAETIFDFAQLRDAQGNNEEARDWYARVLAIHEERFGMHYPPTMETRKRLIALLHTMGQQEEAAQLEATQSEL